MRETGSISVKKQRWEYGSRWMGVAVLLALVQGGALAQTAGSPEPTQPEPQQTEPQQQPVAGVAGTYAMKVTSQNVVLDVVVTDAKGQPVTGLRADDFTVLENKAPQTIRSFEESAPVAVQAGVMPIHSTAELDRVEPEAPVSIVVIDELTTKFEDLAFARYSLKKYLKAQGDTLEQPTMLVAVNYRNIAVLRDYTTSRKEIVEALDHHLADSASLTRAKSLSWAPEQINATFGSLIGVAEATAGHRGHKNMIWIGRGFPPINLETLLPDMLADFEGQLATCTRLLRDSRVTLYAVDPAGIATEQPARDASDFYVEDPFGGQVDFDTMAVATGGKALHGRNDVDRMIDESVRDGESFYTLAYRPPSGSDAPSAFRKIKVVMKNPTLRASTREGYFVAAAPVAPVKEANGKYSRRLIFDMNVASNSLLVYDGVPLTVTRDVATPDAFTLHLKAADLPLAVDASQKPSAELTILVETFDKRGKMLDHSASLQTVRMLAAAPAGGPDARTVGIPVRIATKAPAVRVRFVVRANGSGSVGAENYFLVDTK